GAGVGGCAVAARLAHAGFQVEVYEKNEFSGGRCSLIHHEGYRFDQGPSLVLLPPIFRQLYSDLGTSIEKHVELVQCKPNYTLHFHDGEKVVLSSDRAAMALEVERFEGPEGSERLEGFLREAAVHGKLSYDLVLSQTFNSIFAYLRPSVVINVLRFHIFTSMWNRCEKYFQTDRMRRAFSFGSMYLGSSPFDSPGAYTLLQWSETCEGIWYPKGGFHRVPASLLSIAESHGAKIHYSTPVDSVTYTDGRITGVRLVSGEVKEADVVVVNADLVWAYNNLFKEIPSISENGIAKQLEEREHSCSSVSFYWAMDSVIETLGTHNIFLAEDYKGSFDDIFKRQSMPREPSFYVNVPSRIDPSAAPPGKDTLVVLVPVGHLMPHSSHVRENGQDGVGENTQEWSILVERAKTQVIDVMESRLGISGLREKIIWEEVNTPLTWKDKFNLTHGSILGITHDFWNVLWFRHQARHSKLKGAYFVGASAHPGTGVPISIAGSRLCLQTILSDHSIPLPETYHPNSSFTTTTSALDIHQPKRLFHILEDYLPTILLCLIVFLLTTLALKVGFPSFEGLDGKLVGSIGNHTLKIDF
ncbi:hypothetical protein TREMEDRAFT_34017, partial [Tremella mesenterica DSM 1558]|uniref:uncharacterized protein n=1 Tax=Tremella mesenterica (strain ATCC 24925 / CBS 8224 / DSM 1558 / NBRC 9311 / NRRL Y-6157 / RJB 2259-6 / UBC 559-6) TaxID=578456 RepID=UPI0003F49995